MSGMERERSIAAAEHAIGLLLACSRRLRIVEKEARAGGIPFPYPTDRRLQRELESKNLLLVGFDEIASHVARKARGLELTVRAWDDAVPPAEMGAAGVERVDDLREGLAWCDYVCVLGGSGAIPANAIGREAFSVMKEGSFVVDLGLCDALDRTALRDAVASGRISGAGLDSIRNVALFEDMDKVLITDRCASLVGVHAGGGVIDA